MDWTKYGAWGAAGVLLGILFVYLTEPQTAGGVGVILLVCILFSVVLRGVLKALGILDKAD